jgi:hypothetical protein
MSCRISRISCEKPEFTNRLLLHIKETLTTLSPHSVQANEKKSFSNFKTQIRYDTELPFIVMGVFAYYKHTARKEENLKKECLSSFKAHCIMTYEKCDAKKCLYYHIEFLFKFSDK